MKTTNLIILLFLLSAFSVGIGLQSQDSEFVDSAIDNASLVIENINLSFPTDTKIPNAKGVFKIVEAGVKFGGVAGMEVMRTGIHFGRDNPQYFDAMFIMKIVKLIVILAIVSLLIKPAFYIIVFVGMGIMWIFNKRKDALGGVGEK